MLHVPSNRVIVRTKRMGGGFGGKESKANIVALPAALAATTLGRPVRIMLDRDEDMLTSGTRHPFFMRYKVAYTKEGKITAADVHIYNNAGYSKDLSTSVSRSARQSDLNRERQARISPHPCPRRTVAVFSI